MTEPRTVQLVILSLAVICLTGLGLTGWLLNTGTDATIPGAVTTTALGALGSILATTRTTPPPG